MENSNVFLWMKAAVAAAGGAVSAAVGWLGWVGVLWGGCVGVG